MTNKNINMEEESIKVTESRNFDLEEQARELEETENIYAEKAEKKKPHILHIIIATAITISVLIGVFFALDYIMSRENGNSTGGNNVQNTVNPQSDADLENGNHSYVEVADTDEMRGVWIASVTNINFPSRKGLSANELAAELDTILSNCADVGFNTIFFQVRPCSDALYKSEIFPWSEYLTGTQGVSPENEFDSLEYILSKAPDYGISVHAWINPFRVTNGSAKNPRHDVNALSENHPARINPEYVIPYADGKLYFDPGNPNARKLIISGIEELCKNYPELAGIHLDDYFYPYPVAGAEDFADQASYERYGAGFEKGNFRRNNVNTFIKEAYDTVKSVNPEMKFGVSPFGIWANKTSVTPVQGSESSGLEAYFSLYCDAIAWANGGYVDYLAPQDYWSFSTKAAPFDNIARWWNANLDGTGVDLYIGHAAYKAADYPKNEIAVQVEFSRSLISYKGSIFYGYADIINNTAGVGDSIKHSFESDSGKRNAASPDAVLCVNYPVATTTTDEATYILGVTNSEKPLTVNGKKVSRTADGYFSLYEPLSMGDNVFELESGDETLTYVLKRVKGTSGTSSGSTEMKEFTIESATPDKPLWLIPGDIVVITCKAPSGSRVYAEFGNYKVELLPTLYSANTAKNYKETYKGSIKIDEILASPGQIADLGVITVYAEKNGKTAEKRLSEVKQMGEDVLIYAEVKNDYSYLKRSTTSSFYGDPLPQSVGMRDYITAFVNGYYRLKCGYYIFEDDVEVVRGKALSENKLKKVSVKTNIKDTSNNKNNSTDICFEIDENVPVDVIVKDKSVKVILFGTDTNVIPAVEISKNPLITGGKGYTENGNLVYDFTLRAAENYYGFNVVYENGNLLIKLHNPQTLVQGDRVLSGKTIVVDAGHGGKDIGAQGLSESGSGLNEKNLNLYIALELRDELEAMGANVVMIREDDKTVDLTERTKFLTGIIPDMLISIHHNSVANTVNAAKARGYVGLYSNNAGMLLANSVSDTVVSELSRYQRATAYQALAVARNHRFPSTLCEMSFISYAEEFQWTITEGNYQRSAKALAKGIIEFYERQEKYLNY